MAGFDRRWRKEEGGEANGQNGLGFRGLGGETGTPVYIRRGLGQMDHVPWAAHCALPLPVVLCLCGTRAEAESQD